ncbi:MAG: trehalose-phosphatase, partial [Rhodoferax sp.]|nr:trehalose-phosphatase [Actinomycetota bacterium]
MTDELRARLSEWLRRRPLLVALDFDGVLAPIVEQPEAARALPGTDELLERLAAIDGVHVALVSGRALTSLRAVAQVTPGSRLVLVGSHGAEVDGTDVQLDDDARDALASVHSAFLALAADRPGVHVETKPAGVVLHPRRAPRDVAAQVTEAALGAAARPGCHVTQGKEV